jgi:Flp pilus assembly protein TadG
MTVRRAHFLGDRRGNAAVEFALTLPILAFLIFGTVNLCMVVYAMVDLQSTVEQSARYASTYTSAHSAADPGSTAVTTYATSRYYGPNVGATYTYSSTDHCATYNGSNVGHRVTASGAYKVNFGLGAMTVPLSATACFA